MSSDSNLDENKRRNRTNNAIKVFIVFTAMLASIILIPILVKQGINIKNNAIKENMQEIYKNAETIENIGLGLGEDVDRDGLYMQLSKDSGINVYNKTTNNKYSLIYNSTNKEYIVKYGDKFEYPESTKDNLEVETLDANSLFLFSSTRKGSVIEGLTEEGLSQLSSNKTIEIPKVIGGEPVVEIGSNSFSNMGLESIIIPSGVKKVGQGAFANNGVDRDSVGELSEPFAGRWVITDGVWIKQ